VGGVGVFADVDLDGGEVVFGETRCEGAGLEQRAGLFANRLFAIFNSGLYEIHFRGHSDFPNAIEQAFLRLEPFSTPIERPDCTVFPAWVQGWGSAIDY